jgi:hypothetical protein
VGNRVLLVLAFVAIVVIAASWYAAGAPSRSDSANIPAEIAVAATEAGNGTWVRYVVTVSNAGDNDFSGNVVLMNRGPSDSTTTAAGSAPAPPKLPTSIPQFPSSAPDAAYQFHVVVGARQSQVITMVAPDRYSTIAVAQDPDGALVQVAQVDHSAYVPVAVLTNAQSVTDQLQGVHIDDFVLRLTQYSEARTLPASALGYAPYAAVVIDQFDLGTLSAAQRSALRDYVGQGGGLVVAGGTNWSRTLGMLPPELAPLHPNGAATADDQPVLDLVGRTGGSRVPIAIGPLAAGAEVVTASPDGRPLVSQLIYGGGAAVALAFDPVVEASTSEMPVAAWTEAVVRTFNHSAGAVPSATTMPGISPVTALEFPPLQGAALPSPWLVGPLLLGYLLLVAPVNYLVLRRRLRHPDLLWITAPLIAILFTGGFYFTGAAIQGDLTDEQLQVLKLGPNQTVSELQYHRILFLQRGQHVLQSTQPALAAPLTYDLSSASPADCGATCAIQLTGLRSGQEHVVPAIRPYVIEDGVVYGGVRIVGTAGVVHSPIAVETHLQSIGGRISGDIINRGDRPIHGLVLYSVAGGSFHRTPLASLIAPHGTAHVDSAEQAWDGDPNSFLTGTTARPDAATRLSRAVGLEALSSSGTPWLVGFTDPLPGTMTVDGAMPKQNAITVFEAPVTIEKADATTSDFAIRRLAATSGDRAHGGFTDVYDLELPGRLPPIATVGYDKFQFSSVEVFDWSSQTWQKGAWADDPANQGRELSPLTPAELLASSGGTRSLVRLRVREPRVSWGSALYVFGSG